MGTENIAAAAYLNTGIKLQNISKSFGKTRVLDNLSLDIYQGELCCLLGPSGCGKTTALKITDGLIEQDDGRIFLGSHDITRLPPQKRNLGMVFQNYALFPQLDVFENIAYGLRRRKVSAGDIKKRVNKVLEIVRLGGYERRRVYELSGGQQQRVALARALVIEPSALLLDEPLSNLDARLRADMRHEIKNIQRQLAITMVYVTHDQEEAMSIADRIVVMNQGGVEQIGTARDIYENPKSRFVADFIGRINFIPVEINYKNFKLLGKEYALPGQYLGADTAWMVAAVRPEKIKLSEGNTSGASAVILDVSYIGAVARYTLKMIGMEDAAEIEAEAFNPGKVYQNGEAVGLDVSFEDIRLFL